MQKNQRKLGLTPRKVFEITPICMSKLCQYTTGNNDHVYLLSNTCATKLNKGIAPFVRCCLFLPVNKHMY